MITGPSMRQSSPILLTEEGKLGRITQAIMNNESHHHSWGVSDVLVTIQKVMLNLGLA